MTPDNAQGSSSPTPPSNTSAMDVDIGEVGCRVKTVENGTLLSADVLKNIVASVLAWLRAEKRAEDRNKTDRQCENPDDWRTPL